MTNKIIIQKIVVGAVIVDNDKVLILQRNADEKILPNLWELPSGRREPLETSVQALKREVEEETGLIVEPIKPISVFEYQIEKETEIRDTTQINFLVKTSSGLEVKISSEHQAFAWVKANDLDEYNMSLETKKVIIEAFNNI